MINDEDEGYLKRKLTEWLQPLVNPRQALSTALPPPCMDRISLAQYVGEYVLEALKVCKSNLWQNDPPWLFLLIQYLPDEPQLQRIRDRIRYPPAASADPHGAQVLLGGEPFVDRVTLRRAAGALTTPGLIGKPVLVVTGNSLSGKSYTARYVRHLQASVKSFQFVSARLSRGNGLSWGPRELATTLLTNMGADMTALSPRLQEPTTNLERWPFELAGIVLNEGVRLRTAFWLVLDGFTGRELRADTARFISDLAERIVSSGIFSESFRLVLLGFDSALLTIAQSDFDQEQITPFAEPDVYKCVHAITVLKNKQYTPQQLSELTTTIMTGLSDGHQWVELNARLSALQASL